MKAVFLAFGVALVLTMASYIRVCSAIDINPELAEVFNKMQGETRVFGGRILAPSGPELEKFPEFKRFIFQDSFHYNSLQVLFIGTKPELEMYDPKTGEFMARHDLSDFKHEEIKALLGGYKIFRRDEVDMRHLEL
jgi:hypothetical protein